MLPRTYASILGGSKFVSQGFSRGLFTFSVGVHGGMRRWKVRTYDGTLCDTRNAIIFVVIQLFQAVPMDRCAVVFQVIGHVNDHYAKEISRLLESYPSAVACVSAFNLQLSPQSAIIVGPGIWPLKFNVNRSTPCRLSDLMLQEVWWAALATHIRSESGVLGCKPVLPRDSGIWDFFVVICIDTVLAPATSRCRRVGA